MEVGATSARDLLRSGAFHRGGGEEVAQLGVVEQRADGDRRAAAADDQRRVVRRLGRLALAGVVHAQLDDQVHSVGQVALHVGYDARGHRLAAGRDLVLLLGPGAAVSSVSSSAPLLSAIGGRIIA